MEFVKASAAKPTIRFNAPLVGAGKAGAVLTLPKTASAKLPKGKTTVEATINGFPFRAPLEPDGRGSHVLKVNPVMLDAADAAVGDTAAVEITRLEDDPATRMPADLRAALAAVPKALATWEATTPSARRDWILWMSSGKEAATRELRIGKACSMLGSGKKRVCCFGGLNWLRKDHRTAGENWLPLPKA